MPLIVIQAYRLRPPMVLSGNVTDPKVAVYFEPTGTAQCLGFSFFSQSHRLTTLTQRLHVTCRGQQCRARQSISEHQ